VLGDLRDKCVWLLTSLEVGLQHHKLGLGKQGSYLRARMYIWE
jgi:hypothetical protein